MTSAQTGAILDSTRGAAGQAGPGDGQAAPAEVFELLRSNRAVLIDVREPDEHAREHIPGSRLLPLSGFDPREAAAAARPGQVLVLHCKSGRRSADAARLAAGHCSGEVLCLRGGIEAWKAANLPIEVNRAVSRISVLRQVQLAIGVMVLAGSALAWFVNPAFIGIPAFFGAGLVFAGATGTCGLASLLSIMPWNRGGGSVEGR